MILSLGKTLTWMAALGLTAGWAQTAKTIKWACIGNSITEGAGLAMPYPARLGNKLGPAFQVQNDGVSGTTLLKKGDNPYWKNGKLAQAMAFNPDIITIKLGTNDTKSQNWVNKADFAKDLTAMVDTLLALPSKPQIWLCLPCPIFTNNFGIVNSVAVNEITPIIKQVAETKKLNVIDIYTPLSKYPNLFSDGVHPNDAGADSVASVIYRAFLSKAKKVACIGNSITDYAFPGAYSDAVEGDAYSIRLNMLLGRDYYVENEGVTGLYMQKNADPANSYWGAKGRLRQVFSLQPDIVTIMLGTNDSRASGWNTQRYLQDYRSMADTLKGMKSDPAIFAALPVYAWKVNGEWPFSGISNDLIQDSCMPAIRKVAEEKGLSIIDAHSPFENLKSLVPDGVHPNRVGQDTLARIFYRALTAPPVTSLKLNGNSGKGAAGERRGLQPQLSPSGLFQISRDRDVFSVDGKNLPRPEAAMP